MLDCSIRYSMASSQNKLPLHKDPAGKNEEEKGNKKLREHAPPSKQHAKAESRASAKELIGERESLRDEDDGSHSENSTLNQSRLSAGESGDEEGQRTHQKSFGMLQAKWDEMFTRLVTFREKHGHCLVPNRYTDDPQLGSWVSTQRRQYKILTSGSSESTPMTPERASKLNSIGFVWATKDPRHVPWETRYEELCQFVEKFGHAQVPIGWEENVQLSNWVSTQRQEYKILQKGRSSRLDTDRIKLLNDLGFVWEAQRGGPRRGQKATVSVPDEPRARVGGFSDSASHQASGSSGRMETKSFQATASNMPRQVQSPVIASAAAMSRAQEMKEIQEMQDAAAVAQYLEASRATNQPQFMQYAPNRLLGNFMPQGGMVFPPTVNELTMIQRQHSGMSPWQMLYGAPHHVMAMPNMTASAGGLGMPNPYMTNMTQRPPVPHGGQYAAAAQNVDDGSLHIDDGGQKPAASQKRSRPRNLSQDSESSKSKRSRDETGSALTAASKASGRGDEKPQARSKSASKHQGSNVGAPGEKDEGIFADAEEEEGSWATSTDDELKTG